MSCNQITRLKGVCTTTEYTENCSAPGCNQPNNHSNMSCCPQKPCGQNTCNKCPTRQNVCYPYGTIMAFDNCCGQNLPVSPGMDGEFLTTILLPDGTRKPIYKPVGDITSTILPGSITTNLLADGAVTSAKIADGTITNADVSPSAAIVGSKLDFSGSTPLGFCTAINNCLANIPGYAPGTVLQNSGGTLTWGGGGTGGSSYTVQYQSNGTNTGTPNPTTINITGAGIVATQAGSTLTLNVPGGTGAAETARAPEFFQNQTSGSTVPLSSPPAAGTVIQVFRNGQLWHPQGQAPDKTWTISGSTITFSEPFGNSVNGSTAEIVAVFFIKN